MEREITVTKSITRAVEDIVEEWKKDLHKNESDKTIETYTIALNQYTKYLEERGIVEVTDEDVIAYRDYLKESHKTTTVQNYLAAVKSFYKWAQKKGYCQENIAEGISGGKLDNEHKRDYLTTRQVNKLLSSVDRSTLKGKRDYAILTLMVTTGLRTISVSRANIEDIKTVGDDRVLFYQGKGHDERAVYVKLAAQVEDAINDYLAARGETDQTAPLFISTSNNGKGTRLTAAVVSSTVKACLRKAGLDSDRLTAHSLRHTAATLNLLNGGSIEETQQLLNHSNINTTMIYVHALTRANNNSENRIAEAIFA